MDIKEKARKISVLRASRLVLALDSLSTSLYIFRTFSPWICDDLRPWCLDHIGLSGIKSFGEQAKSLANSFK
jgi:hypothetical protein